MPPRCSDQCFASSMTTPGARDGPAQRDTCAPHSAGATSCHTARTHSSTTPCMGFRFRVFVAFFKRAVNLFGKAAKLRCARYLCTGIIATAPHAHRGSTTHGASWKPIIGVRAESSARDSFKMNGFSRNCALLSDAPTISLRTGRHTARSQSISVLSHSISLES